MLYILARYDDRHQGAPGPGGWPGRLAAERRRKRPNWPRRRAGPACREAAFSAPIVPRGSSSVTYSISSPIDCRPAVAADQGPEPAHRDEDRLHAGVAELYEQFVDHSVFVDRHQRFRQDRRIRAKPRPAADPPNQTAVNSAMHCPLREKNFVSCDIGCPAARRYPSRPTRTETTQGRTVSSGRMHAVRVPVGSSSHSVLQRDLRLESRERSQLADVRTPAVDGVWRAGTPPPRRRARRSRTSRAKFADAGLGVVADVDDLFYCNVRCIRALHRVDRVLDVTEGPGLADAVDGKRVRPL